MAKTLQQLLVVNTVGVAGSSSIKDPETIDIIPHASLASARPGNKQFTVNLTSRHEIREETGTARPVQRILTFQLTKATSDAVDGEAGDKEETRRKLAADLLGQCRPGREASRPAGHAQDGRDHRG